MAGIFGFVQYGKQFNGKSACEKLVKVSRQGFLHPGKYLIEKDGSAAIGFAFPQFYQSVDWPLESADGAFWLQVFGDIILPGGKHLSKDNFESEFLKPFSSNGVKLVNKLDGAFVFALYDRVKKQLWIFNDLFGSYALHFATFFDGLIFASQMEGISRVLSNTGLDENGILEYLAIGQTLNGRTFFRDVRRLPPASYLTISEKKVQLKMYYRPEYEAAPKKELPQLFNNLKTSFINSVSSRIFPGKTIAALTGGFDSRVTWGTILYLEETPQVRAVTHGMEKSRDVRISKKIARELGIEQILYLFDENFIKDLPSYWRKIIRLSEGVIPIDTSHALAFWEFCREKGYVLLDSHGGALYRRQFMKASQKLIAPRGKLAQQVFRFWQMPLIGSGILKKEAVDAAVHETIDSLASYFNDIEYCGNLGDKIDLFYLQQVSALKYSVAANVQQNFIGLHHPFLNNEMFKQVLRIPETYRRGNKIHSHILHHLYPALEKYSLDNMGMPAPYKGFSFWRYGPMGYQLILRKLQSWIPVQFLNKLSLQNFVTDYQKFLLQNYSDMKDILLSDNLEFNHLVEKDILEKKLRQYGTKPANLSAEMIQLLSLKLFVDEKI